VRFIGGPLDWNSNKESWRAKTARKIKLATGTLSPRRVRAILSNTEKVRLTADEYVAIEQAWVAAGGCMEAFSDLAREADVAAYSAALSASDDPKEGCATPDSRELNPASRAAIRPNR
jgi:hypothetical protein